MTQEQEVVAASVARAFRFGGPGAFGGVNALQRQMAVEADIGEELESLERASLRRAFEEVIESSRGPAAGAESPEGTEPQWRLAVRRAAKQAAKEAKRPRTRAAKATRRNGVEASRPFAPA